MREKLRDFMIGRYGNDSLGHFLMGVSLVSLLLSSVFRSLLLRWIAWGLLIWEIYRFVSRDTGRRSQENAMFYALKNKFTADAHQKKTEWAQRNEYRFFRCPNCGQKLRVPTGRGKISITCPKCQNEFIKKS